jgi:hypothetical protein
MSLECKLSLNDRISNIATLSQHITGTGGGNVADEIEQCQTPYSSLANDETKEISRFPTEICDSESGIQVMLQDPLSFGNPLSLKVDLSRFLDSLPSNPAVTLYQE